MDDLTLARIINKLHGGAVVTALDVGQLDETWMDFFLSVALELPRERERQTKIKNLFDKFEREHPTYGLRFKQ
jgi:hypothetical protein